MSESIQKVADQIVVFTLEEQLYAFSLNAVHRVINAVEIRHLPDAPEIISGILNINGRIIPVADIRKRLGLAVHLTSPDDHFIIASAGKREIAIPVDFVTGVRELAPLQLPDAIEKLTSREHIRGVAKLEDDLILIYDLERFLSLDEEKDLHNALNKNGNES
jgi:purine-binding chemotaxis protein CheW